AGAGAAGPGAVGGGGGAGSGAGGGGGGGRRGGGGGGPGRFGTAARLDSILPNPPAQVLALRDSIVLMADQVTTLEAARDSLASELRVMGDSMRSAAGGLDASGDRQADRKSTRLNS